jgi:uncharacterized protein YecE (DUF72 family)
MLPTDLRAELAPPVAAKPNIDWHDLSPEVHAALWQRFWRALQPLYHARKLGAVLLQLPQWVFPSDESRQHLLGAKAALPEYRLAVEFGDVSWVSSRNVERTMDFLRHNDLT